MDRNIVITLSKKIIRVVVAVKIAGKCVILGKKVYDCIPKYDTFKDIDIDALIQQNMVDLSAIDLATPKDLPEIP